MAARFGQVSHRQKAKLADLDPGHQEFASKPLGVLIADDYLLGGNVECNGCPTLHTGNPTEQDVPTVTTA